MKIVFHHFDPEQKDVDNAIPLCFDCHAEIKMYDLSHPIGTKYIIDEIKRRREQIYEKHTRHLVPPINYSIITRKLPDVGFSILNEGANLPVKARVETKIILGNERLKIEEDPHGYYSGEGFWHLNPHIPIHGHFGIPEKCTTSSQKLRIEVRVTIEDQYERNHKQLPLCWSYKRKKKTWVLEPRSFSKWY